MAIAVLPAPTNLRRDEASAIAAESRAFAESGILAIPLARLRAAGVDAAADEAVAALGAAPGGIWVHLDATRSTTRRCPPWTTASRAASRPRRWPRW